MLQELFADKALKPKERTEQLARLVTDGTVEVEQLMLFAAKGKPPIKATCMESLEFATRQKPEIISAAVLDFVVSSLADKAPRTKWESAKVIGNTIHLFPGSVPAAVNALLANTEDTGTVVRWSAAFALGQVLKLKTPINNELVPAIEAIMAREEKNSIKKIYQAALKNNEKINE